MSDRTIRVIQELQESENRLADENRKLRAEVKRLDNYNAALQDEIEALEGDLSAMLLAKRPYWWPTS